ncbi:MAG: hypothetical protein MRY21_02805 [Simkaniaceae bacterium]|nr:hypothetical protein [Simkaniaceae bacterium]
MVKCFRILLLFGLLHAYDKGILYSSYGCRSGDRLLHYTKASWVAYRHRLPLYIVHFSFADHLNLFYTDHYYDERVQTSFPKVVMIKSEGGVRQRLSDNTLFDIGFQFRKPGWDPYEVGTWKELMEDAAFREHLRSKIAPVKKMMFAPLPKECLSVAIHIRDGGGLDFPRLSKQLFAYQPQLISTSERETFSLDGYCDGLFPLKFPPLQYYINSLRKLSNRLGNPPIYAYVFTDSLTPEKLVGQLKRQVDLPNIKYRHHEKTSGPSSKILEDMMDMARYDCLIRGGSNYSQISHLIGRHKIVVFPKASFWYRGCLIMHPIEFSTATGWENLRKRFGNFP